jgi:hypothetical protein
MPYLMLRSSIRINQYRDTSLIDINVYREDRLKRRHALPMSWPMSTASTG